MTSNPNIFYGGDFELNLDYPTLGNFLIKFLKLGEDRDCLVRIISFYITEINFNFHRLMEKQVKFGVLKEFSMKASKWLNFFMTLELELMMLLL